MDSSAKSPHPWAPKTPIIPRTSQYKRRHLTSPLSMWFVVGGEPNFRPDAGPERTASTSIPQQQLVGDKRTAAAAASPANDCLDSQSSNKRRQSICWQNWCTDKLPTFAEDDDAKACAGVLGAVVGASSSNVMGQSSSLTGDKFEFETTFQKARSEARTHEKWLLASMVSSVSTSQFQVQSSPSTSVASSSPPFSVNMGLQSPAQSLMLAPPATGTTPTKTTATKTTPMKTTTS